jgi:hypothetical protein
MGTYHEPSFSAPSSVILLVLGIVSIFCTVLPVMTMTRIGMKSQLAELTACINFAMMMWSISSLPYVYEHYHLCAAFGFCGWYALVQLVVAASLMMYGAKEYIMQIQGIHDGDTLTLTFKQRLLLYLFPAIPPLFPLLTRSYGHMFCWCTVDLDSKYGGASFIILFVAIWSPVLFVIYQYFKIASKVKNTMGSSEVFYKVALNGPIMYGSTTIILLLTSVCYYTIAGLAYHRQSAAAVYHGNYVFAILVCVLGISYGIIFVHNLEHVKVHTLLLCTVECISIILYHINNI